MSANDDLLFTLLKNLSRARIAADDFGSEPWLSNSPSVIEAWRELTDPIHLQILNAELLRANELNSSAQSVIKAALTHCEQRFNESTGDRGFGPGGGQWGQAT